MDKPKPGIEIYEDDPGIYGAKKSLLRGALLDAIRQLITDLDPRIPIDPRRQSKSWPDRDREEELRGDIILLLQILPRIEEGPF